jgi:tetratricopeptide (TPR) repeat protein
MLAVIAPQARAQCASAATPSVIHHLYIQKDWPEVVHAAGTVPKLSADDQFDLAMALAHLQKWPDARQALLSGHRQCPQQERFPVELAGVAFQVKRYSEAASWLRQALKLGPRDEYALNFAATVYYLEGNVEAALKYWNRVQKPAIAALRLDPQLHVHRLLLDRAFAFAPASVLARSQYQTTELRLRELGIFAAFNINLNARSDGSFDAQFHAIEQNGFGNNRLQAFLSTFGGAFYGTIYPDYFNFARSAINVESLLRWDAQKRRAWVSISGPLHQFPQFRWQFVTDNRNENWDIRRSFSGPAPLLGSLNLQRQLIAGSISGFPRGSLQWSSGIEASHRSYRDVDPGSALTPSLLASGYQLAHLASIRGTVFDFPERRFKLSAGAVSKLARLWSVPSRGYEKLTGSAEARWFPQASGDLYEMSQQIRAGYTFGHAPFDELFMLGVERDNDLWLRGLVGTRDGRKGSSPLGDRYFLSNSDFGRRIYSNGLFTAKVGPFLDIGRSHASTTALSRPEWLFSAGLQTRLTLFGTGVVFTWGRDLRTGSNAFFATLASR